MQLDISLLKYYNSCNKNASDRNLHCTVCSSDKDLSEIVSEHNIESENRLKMIEQQYIDGKISRYDYRLKKLNHTVDEMIYHLNLKNYMNKGCS